MAEVSKLPLDGEPVGVNQIRNKINEIIDEGVGGGGGTTIGTGTGGSDGIYTDNLANELLVIPADGTFSSEWLRNASGTYIQNGATEKITDFPVHQNKITDQNGINHFAILVDGKLYVASGNEGAHYHVPGDGATSHKNVRPGLENMRQYNLGGYYNDKPDIEVLDFHFSGHLNAVLMSDGILWGWGTNNVGQLAQGHASSCHTPVIIDRNVTRFWPSRIHNGTDSSLYWENSTDYDYQLRCAGYNGQGQLADGTTTHANSASKPYVITEWNHLGDYHSYRLKQVYNFSANQGFVFIVLQHKTDARVQQVIACGANSYGQLGIDRYDTHTAFGPASHAPWAGQEVILTNPTNVTKWLWCKTRSGLSSWQPKWRVWNDSSSQEILGFYAGTGYAGANAGNYPWAVCWTRVWSGYGQYVQGDFLRAAGSNYWQQLGALNKGFGTRSNASSSYKTFSYIPPIETGYTWDEALALMNYTGVSGARLAAPTNLVEWNQLHVDLVEFFTEPNSQDFHHSWLAIRDDEGEGWWKNYHTNKLIDRNAMPWGRPQADDAGSRLLLQGHVEFVYQDPTIYGVRTEDFTEYRYTNPQTGEQDGIVAVQSIDNPSQQMGRGIHDQICIGRAESTTTNYIFAASTECTNTTNGTFTTQLWRSQQSGNPSWAVVGDSTKFSVSNIHPACDANVDYKLHYVNPYVGKFVHLEDLGDLLYISWHHNNDQLVCARTVDLGGTWTYSYSTIDGAWGQRYVDENNTYSTGNYQHSDAGCTSAVYLGDGVIVAAFGGAYKYSGHYVGEVSNSQALLVRSFDYGRNWHIIGDEDIHYTFSNLTPLSRWATHYNIGRYYDRVSNKYRLICFAGSGGVVGRGDFDERNPSTIYWTQQTDAFALAYSDDYGDTWNWCQIDGQEINYDYLDTDSWPNRSDFRGDLFHFCEQQSKVLIVRTHFEKALETNVHESTRANWGETCQAFTYISSDGGRTFVSLPAGDTPNLLDQNAGIVSADANNSSAVALKMGGDLNKTGVPFQEANLGKSYRNIIKLEAYGSDGVAVFWQRNGDQQYQGPGYGDASTFDNNTIELGNYKYLPIPGGEPFLENWILSGDVMANYPDSVTDNDRRALFSNISSISISDDGNRMAIGLPYEALSVHSDPSKFTAWDGHYPRGVVLMLQKDSNENWSLMPTQVEGVNRYFLHPHIQEYQSLLQATEAAGASAYDDHNMHYRFGYSVSLSGDGNTVAISAPGHGWINQNDQLEINGETYTFKWNGTRWTGNRSFNEGPGFSDTTLMGHNVKLNYDASLLVTSRVEGWNEDIDVWSRGANHYTWNKQRNLSFYGGENIGTDLSVSHDQHTAQKMQYIAVGGWTGERGGDGLRIAVGGWTDLSSGLKKWFFEDDLRFGLYANDTSLIQSQYVARDWDDDLGFSGSIPYMNKTPPGWTAESLYDIAQEIINVKQATVAYIDFSRYSGYARQWLWFDDANRLDLWDGMPSLGLGTNGLYDTGFGSFVRLSKDGTTLLVGAPLYRVISGNTPSRLITSTNLNKRLGAVYMFKWDHQYGLAEARAENFGGTDFSYVKLGNWVNVMGDNGPLYVGHDLDGDYGGNVGSGYNYIPFTIGSTYNNNINPHDRETVNYSVTPGWANTFEFSDDELTIVIKDGHGQRIAVFDNSSSTPVLHKYGQISGLNVSPYSNMRYTSNDGSPVAIDPNGKFLYTATYGMYDSWAGMTIAKFNTNQARHATPWQPEHRLTVLHDIMEPTWIPNCQNVADYFINEYHYSWASNATYKRIFTQGSYLTGSYLPNSSLLFCQGGYGNLNYGSTIFLEGRHMPREHFHVFGLPSSGERVAHVMAGSFHGYDGWRDSSVKTGQHYIFQAGGCFRGLLNDINAADVGSGTTRAWGDYNGSTRYFGYIVEKEVDISGAKGTQYLGRDSAHGQTTVNVAIPDINRFTSPESGSEYTQIVNNPVIQIRDIRHNATGPGGLIVTLSNGNVWTTGHNSQSQRAIDDYINTTNDVTARSYPNLVPHPEKTTSDFGWDKCLLVTNPAGTENHHASVFMRDQNNRLWGWGNNDQGELGVGHNTRIARPESAILAPGIRPRVMGQMATASGGPITVMITDEGRMFAAGRNDENAIAEGDGARGQYYIFIPIRNPLP